jgi:hypothetical protein
LNYRQEEQEEFLVPETLGYVQETPETEETPLKERSTLKNVANKKPWLEKRSLQKWFD